MRKTGHLCSKVADTHPEWLAIALKAQKRLCGRYRRLNAAGKHKCKVATAITRELSGFIRDIVCNVIRTGETDVGRRAAA